MGCFLWLSVSLFPQLQYETLGNWQCSSGSVCVGVADIWRVSMSRGCRIWLGVWQAGLYYQLDPSLTSLAPVLPRCCSAQCGEMLTVSQHTYMYISFSFSYVSALKTSYTAVNLMLKHLNLCLCVSGNFWQFCGRHFLISISKWVVDEWFINELGSFGVSKWQILSH